MVAAAASPSPHAAGRPHPTYTKMITHALAELGGASPRAGIAGHILGRGYSGLPARHDELLSAHLRRLLAEGVLRLLHDAHGPSSSTYLFAPAEEQKRGPGRPPRKAEATPPAAAASAVKLGEKRGRGRPRKNTGIAAHSAGTTKRGRQQGPEAFQNGVQQAGAFPNHNGCAVHVQSSGGRGGVKTGCGRPWKQKPPSSPAAAMSPAPANNNTVSSSTAVGVKRGRGRPRKEKPSAAAAASRGFKRGCGRPSPSVSPASYGNGVFLRKERLAGAAKRGRGRPRKDQRVGGGLVEKRAYEVFFRDMMMAQASTGQEEEEDLVLSGQRTPQTEDGAAPGDGRDTSRATADAGCVPVSGENNATSAPVGAVGSDHLGPADLPAADVVSTGLKRGRGRPRKEKPAAAMPAETGDDDASLVIEQEGGTPRMEELAPARSPETTGDAAAPTGVKRPRGRPRKNPPAAAMPDETRDAAASTGGVKRGRGRPPKKKPASAMSAETGDAASTGVKRGRGRPRKEKPAAAATGDAGVKRGRGRPMRAGSVGTWFAELAAERELFGNMAEEEAPGNREEARVADDAGRVPVSGENAAAAPVEAGNDSDFGPASP